MRFDVESMTAVYLVVDLLQSEIDCFKDRCSKDIRVEYEVEGTASLPHAFRLELF